MTAAIGQGYRPRPPLQLPACDRCAQGVMDTTNPHYLGTCGCECHVDVMTKRGKP